LVGGSSCLSDEANADPVSKQGCEEDHCPQNRQLAWVSLHLPSGLAREMVGLTTNLLNNVSD
jgi:hypothetical protein